MNHEIDKIVQWLVKASWNELDAGETRQLEEWLNASEENRQLYERLIHENEIGTRYALWKKLDERQALEKVRRQLDGHPRKRVLRRWLPYAAVIAAGIFIAFWTSGGGDRPSPAELPAILPGE
jgi:ferric-dicitrate binding protein FerR (iron transport regulator)